VGNHHKCGVTLPTWQRAAREISYKSERLLYNRQEVYHPTQEVSAGDTMIKLVKEWYFVRNDRCARYCLTLSQCAHIRPYLFFKQMDKQCNLDCLNNMVMVAYLDVVPGQIIFLFNVFCRLGHMWQHYIWSQVLAHYIWSQVLNVIYINITLTHTYWLMLRLDPLRDYLLGSAVHPFKSGAEESCYVPFLDARNWV